MLELVDFWGYGSSEPGIALFSFPPFLLRFLLLTLCVVLLFSSLLV